MFYCSTNNLRDIGGRTFRSLNQVGSQFISPFRAKLSCSPRVRDLPLPQNKKYQDDLSNQTYCDIQLLKLIAKSWASSPIDAGNIVLWACRPNLIWLSCQTNKKEDLCRSHKLLGLHPLTQRRVITPAYLIRLRPKVKPIIQQIKPNKRWPCFTLKPQSKLFDRENWERDKKRETTSKGKNTSSLCLS